MGRYFTAAMILVTVVFIVALVVPSAVLNADQYQAFAAGIQAFGVVAALASGAMTLAREARDKRVDRTVALYQEFQSGSRFGSRYRLAEVLEDEAAAVSYIPIAELKRMAYQIGQETPGNDADTIMRYFEALNSLRIAGALDEGLAHRLLGRNILYWDHALPYTNSTHLRQPLRDLAEWVRSMDRRRQPPYIAGWTKSLQRNYGPTISQRMLYETPSWPDPPP